MGVEWVPSTVDRLRATVVGAPRALVVSLGDPSQAFDPTEGGGWVWYPMCGSFTPPYRFDRWWSLRGRGGGVVGSFTQLHGRARFVPSPYWHRNGMTDWDAEVNDVERDGRWMRVNTPAGSIVVRER